MSRSSRAAGAPAFDLAARARRRAACTAGIYRIDDRRGWTAVGAGVCLRLAGRAFVLSTGRVLAPHRDAPWLGRRSAAVPLVAAMILADGPGAPPEVATLDVAFALLSGDDVEVLAGELGFVSLADVAASPGEPDDTYYAVPATPVNGAGDADPAAHPAFLRLRAGTAADYRRHGVTSGTHLVLRSDGEADATDVRERLRGCGVWRATAAGRDPLAGIVTGGEGGPTPCLVATRPCFAVLGIVGCLGAGLPDVPSVRGRN